jgi:cyclophilin family peptidyl-prolyl cis-trans isomerase/HEAT repeat protein
MKYSIILLVLLASCSDKNKNAPNQWVDDKLITIYELQDRRDTEGLIPFLKAKKESHRVAAALAFASAQDTLAIPYLNQMLQIDQDPMPRRAAAFALGQIGHPKALQILRSAFDGELLNENRRYILEAIGKCGDSSTLSLFENTEYTDSNLNVGWWYGVYRLGLKGYFSESLVEQALSEIRAENAGFSKQLAAAYLQRYHRKNPSANKEEIRNLIQLKNASPVSTQLQLIIPNVDKIKTESEILKTERFGQPWQAEFAKKVTDYEKAIHIDNLKDESTSAAMFLLNKVKSDTVAAVIRNAAFAKYCQFYPSQKWNLISYALRSTDMALQSLAAIEIQGIGKPKYTPELNAMWNTLVMECNQVKSKLQLPQQAETYIDICKAIGVLGGEKFTGYKPKYNNPIDWNFVKTIPAKQEVLIKTTKGAITIQLFVNDAPGTVSNFLKLVDSGFYDTKYFHRVVPQFVIQGGCPRGDGWGSLNWTQRSEFSNYQTYSEGTVGMASAGLDTEGVQFFITHCPTPHLDGRYSIFARVMSGMEVVNKITVGDKIVSIKRK